MGVSAFVPQYTLGCFSTLISIICLIVIIIKIGQSAANLWSSCYTKQDFPQDNQETSLSEEMQSYDLEDQAQSEELGSLSHCDYENLIEEGSPETTRRNEQLIDSPSPRLLDVESLRLWPTPAWSGQCRTELATRANISNHRPHHRYPSNDLELGYYLAGLIDGDGSLSLEHSQPTITITFHKKDTFLAYKIKSILSYGRVRTKGRSGDLPVGGSNCSPMVRSYSSYTIYTLTNREGLVKMIYLVHNKLRLPHKVSRLNKFIERYNLPLMKSTPDKSNVTLTHYLAGLLDSDGSLSIKLLRRARGLRNTEKFEVRLLARVELNYILGSSVINKLKEDLDGSLSTRKIEYSETKTLGERTSQSISWSSVSFARMYQLLVYLDRYNLCSKKYLEYYYLRKAYILIQNNHHLTLEGQMKLASYQKRMSILKHDK